VKHRVRSKRSRCCCYIRRTVADCPRPTVCAMRLRIGQRRDLRRYLLSGPPAWRARLNIWIIPLRFGQQSCSDVACLRMLMFLRWRRRSCDRSIDLFLAEDSRAFSKQAEHSEATPLRNLSRRDAHDIYCLLIRNKNFRKLEFGRRAGLHSRAQKQFETQSREGCAGSTPIGGSRSAERREVCTVLG